SYGVEYFCTEGDEFWSRGDEDIVKVAVGELKKIGLLGDQQVLESHVIRQKKAYPVYDEAYAAGIELIKREVGNKVENLHLVGRNGMHRYNNQDHAVMTAMLTVRNILAGRELFDVWRVNQDAEYIEDGGDH
ncbi:MAG: FAD-dependent oxidoreductase, partial [Bdellovibrionota bacterium]